MTSGPDGQLWCRGMGIRFAPSPKPTPLYTQLDSPRCLHDSSTSAVGATGSQPRVNADQYHILTNEPVPNASVLASKEPQVKPVDVPLKVDLTLGKDVGEAGDSAKKSVANESTPPLTSLSYQIAPELFHHARGRPQGSSDSYWSHTMYQCIGVDGTKTNVKVHYCTSKHTMEYVCRKYFVGEKVLGFDLEWDAWATREMDVRQNVSLIQMASPGHIGLFHCALFSKNDFVAPTFKKIMEDAEVSKVGVNIRGDCTKVRKHLGVDTRGIFELSHMYKMVKYIKEGRTQLIDKVAVSLATQVQECLGLPLRKSGDVRLSNWSRYLNQQQILYSASDAYAGIQLYYVLDEERQKLEPCPPRPYHAELGLPIPIPKSYLVKTEEGAIGAATSTPVESKEAEVAIEKAGKKAKFRDDRVTVADEKMQEYRSSKPGKVTVGPSALRAYYIWHNNEDLKPDDIAQLLREPPLHTNTVVSYILDAVMRENMPYCKIRMREELLSTISDTAMRLAKYQTLIKSCQDSTLDAQA